MKKDSKPCPFGSYLANNKVEKLCGAEAINERVKWWQEGKKKLKERNGR